MYKNLMYISADTQHSSLVGRMQENYEIVHAFKTNDNRKIQEFYKANFQNIRIMVLQNSGTEEHAKDLYQDAFTIVWRNVINNKYKPQKSADMAGYLYRIAKYKWLDELKKKGKMNMVDIDSINSISNTQEIDIDKLMASEKKFQRVEYAFEKLGEDCRNLLKQFYTQRKALAEIAEQLNIQEKSAKNKKYRCMQKLRQLVLTDNITRKTR